jgi:hypothetical protein
VPQFLIGFANVVLVAWALALRRRPRARRHLARLAATCGALVAASLAGAVAWYAHVASTVDVSRKADLLSRGVSTAANWGMLGALTFSVPGVLALVMALRAPRERA